MLGLGVHLLGADLDLDPHLLVMDDGGVDRTVAVALGRRDEVLEAARHDRPALVDQAERAIAFLDRADDGAEGHDVGQLLEADMALGHLAPDRIGMLLAALDLGLDAVRLEMRLDAAADPLDEVAAAALVEPLEPLGDRFIGVGLELAKGEGLHLGHELVHADPLGERRVDVHRLAGDAAALVRVLEVMERAHVVEPVGELDQQDADVVRHGEQELAQILGRALAFALRLDLGELGDAVDEAGDVLAEQFPDLGRRRQRVLDRVVEDRGDDRLVVEPQIGEDAGDLDRVAVIGIARGAGLEPCAFIEKT